MPSSQIKVLKKEDQLDEMAPLLVGEDPTPDRTRRTEDVIADAQDPDQDLDQDRAPTKETGSQRGIIKIEGEIGAEIEKEGRVEAEIEARTESKAKVRNKQSFIELII